MKLYCVLAVAVGPAIGCARVGPTSEGRIRISPLSLRFAPAATPMLAMGAGDRAGRATHPSSDPYSGDAETVDVRYASVGIVVALVFTRLWSEESVMGEGGSSPK